jgi:hypothetical protein
VAQLYPSSPLSTIALVSPLRASCPPKLAAVGAFLVEEEEYLLGHRMWPHFVSANQ